MHDQLPAWMQQAALRSQLPAWMQQDPPPKKKSALLGPLTELSDRLGSLPFFKRAGEEVRAMGREALEHPKTFLMGMVGPGELGAAGKGGLGELASRLIGKDHNPDVLNVVRGLVRNEPMPRVSSVNAEKAQHMAKVYESLPKNDPAAKAAYDALNAEVAAQMQAIKDAGYQIEYVDKDPYANSAEMMQDVRENKRLKVFKTPGESFHPYMTPEQNDAFRAVHDWIAHAGPGNQFGPVGEENAYRMHAATLSPEAQRALATETRGQNSWVNFGPNSHLPVKERPFAEQKAALWPEDLLGDYDAMKAEPERKNNPLADSLAVAAPRQVAQAALRFHVPGEAEPRVYTGRVHPQARMQAEDELGDLLDDNFEPRFKEESGFLDNLGNWLSREEAASIAKQSKQLGGNARAVEAVKRSGQLKAEALQHRDVYSSLMDEPEPAAAGPRGFGLFDHIPEQSPLTYFRGPKTDPNALDEAYELSRKAFRPKGPYKKFLKAGGEFPGAKMWYDTRGIYKDAADEIGPEAAAERVNSLLGNFMPASTARSAPPSNLKRAFLWQGLADRGLVTPEMLKKGPLDVPAGFGHFAQSTAHQPALARAIETGKVDPIINPKPASFGANLTGNMEPGTFDTVMSRLARVLDPKLEKFLTLKGEDASPRDWAYQPLERGLADAAKEAQKVGLLELEPGLSPTASYQSMGWHGATPSAEYGSMYDIWNAMRDESAKMWGVTPAQANRMIWKEGRVPLMPLDMPLQVKPRAK